jgi:uncharacterized membrane protein YbhN (UPF0104 family)
MVAVWVILATITLLYDSWSFLGVLISIVVLFFGLAAYLGRLGFTGFNRMSEEELSEYDLNKAASIIGISTTMFSYSLLILACLLQSLNHDYDPMTYIGAFVLLFTLYYPQTKRFKNYVRKPDLAFRSI